MDSIYAGRAMPSNTEMTLFWQNLTTALKDMQESAKPPRDALEAAAIGIRGQPVKVATAKK
jgi:maltose/maltodextrin transport system substrate-binding protein